jgi:hypothetical protein
MVEVGCDALRVRRNGSGELQAALRQPGTTYLTKGFFISNLAPFYSQRAEQAMRPDEGNGLW